MSPLMLLSNNAKSLCSWLTTLLFKRVGNNAEILALQHIVNFPIWCKGSDNRVGLLLHWHYGCTVITVLWLAPYCINTTYW